MCPNQKWPYLLAVALLTFISWIYVTSTEKYRKNTLFIKKYKYFTEDYLLQPKNTLCSENPFLIIIVTSYVGHVELRSAHRRAMSPEYLRAMNASRVFLLSRIPTRETEITQAAVKDESDTFGDILQGTFEEHYRNLTHKHLMGLRWAAEACQNATYILKLDDDIVFNLNRTYQLLSKVNLDDKDLFMGKVMHNMQPKRMKQNKWYVTWDEYPSTMYPPFLSGWFYITTPKVAGMLTDRALYHPYFWIDDVFITGILAEILGLKLSDVPKNFWMDYYENVECCITDMLKKKITCNYAVGPNGGRNNLIVEFNDAIDKCSERKCTKNQGSEPSCVHWKEREIFSDGRGEIQMVKVK